MMRRKGIHKPTIEDLVEMSPIETLHPGGFALTRRTAELCGLKTGRKVLDVSSGRGTQAIFYEKEFGVEVTGVDLSEEMVQTATNNALKAGTHRLFFKQGDSQKLPFETNTFDAVINECAVGIPDDSQKVLDEMVRVAKPGGAVAIHESTWRQTIRAAEKEEIAERYGTTPLEYEEWTDMLKKAGVNDVITEFEEWSKPEMFWKIRKDRDVKSPSKVLTWPERLQTISKVIKNYGLKGVFKALTNEKTFYRTVLEGKLGYCLYKGVK
jgi:SAM-dependent methyltransferase